uniref:Uncharacterized protein n=1 Tax=viral metagenome TaxID=1070528 RepID=A0A6H1ZKY3_9ZZZZ
MMQRIVIVGDDGLPLKAGRQYSAEEMAHFSRGGDLMMAFQWGEEAARGDYETELIGFKAKFQGDAEARQRFDEGVASVSKRPMG